MRTCHITARPPLPRDRLHGSRGVGAIVRLPAGVFPVGHRRAVAMRGCVAPYLQITRPVRHAVRLGYLRPGDRLPTAKEVVRRLAINPNTVLKAYHDLEHEGLVEARPGWGPSWSASCRALRCRSSQRSGDGSPSGWRARARPA